MTWRTCTDFLKKSDLTLRLADRLGRGRGDLRLLDDLTPPPASPVVPDLADWESRRFSAVWIGHATVLLRLGGLTILTDPVMAHRVGLGLLLLTCGPRRKFAPAVPLAKLPRPDVILISHAHFDHLDRQTLARLPKSAAVVTASHTCDLIRDLGYRRITELKWGQRVEFMGVGISARPVAHWGARTFLDRHRGYNAYVIDADGQRILYGGDTAYHEGFKEIGGVDLAILGIGAYDPYIQAHATPEQAWAMANQVGADFVLPIHHSTFRLSHEPMHEPMERLLAAAGREADRIIIRRIGQEWSHGN